jgi:hypothetical protein
MLKQSIFGTVLIVSKYANASEISLLMKVSMRFFHSVGLERTSGNRIHPQIELSFTEFKPLMGCALSPLLHFNSNKIVIITSLYLLPSGIKDFIMQTLLL